MARVVDDRQGLRRGRRERLRRSGGRAGPVEPPAV